MNPKRRILFARFGHFSHVNDHVTAQIARNFPDHEVMDIDTKSYLRRDPIASAFNGVTEVLTFGPSVLRNRADRHTFFYRTPFMFRRLNEMLTRDFGAIADELDFVIQTQGMFNARIGDAPLLIYTDYTSLDNLDTPSHDRRLFRSAGLLRHEADMYLAADAVAVTGSHVARTLVERYGCDPARVRTVHVGANVAIAPVSTDQARYDAKHVVFVGVDWERKGGPALVEGFRQAARDYPDARLTIVGCSPSVADPRITVAGAVPPAAIPGYYEAASVFCMPSLIEPLGIAAVEASLFRLPVVATKIGGFFETVTDGETGILVPPGDPAAIAGALRRLFAAPDLARLMGLAGFERNRIRFNWDEVGKRLRSIAETIAPRLRVNA